MKSTARRRCHCQTFNVFTILLSILAAVAGVQGLVNVTMDMPEAVAAGATVTLTCKYDLEQQALYAVKWYKGRKEFYRYVLKDMPHKSVFGDFVHKIDKSQSDEHRVVLTHVTPDLDGRYHCEVSTDQPDFLTMIVSSHMHVANLPDGGPELRVEKLRYEVGDTIRGNCSTPPSNPPANVTWIINGHPVNASFVELLNATNDNRTRTFAGLDFEIIPDSFKNGRLQIVCHANVYNLYNERADVVLDEEKPKLASVLGTRDSPHTATASRGVAQWMYVGVAANLLLCGLR